MVYIDKESCKGCGICISVCPKKIIKYSQNLNKKGVHYPEIIDESKCILCENCMIYCPDFAVVVKKYEKQ